MQKALAAFIADNSLDKHIAKSRRHYTKLNRIMRQKLCDLPEGIKISGLDSGIHAFMSFDKMPIKLIKKLNQNHFTCPIRSARVVGTALPLAMDISKKMS
ncbi:MAG: hypothetical protein H6912_06040 [Kordiimonadaceae bacterium]|nr:hypothetical protein [Kordiimonadaceae bacterium]